jgi:hypothetical protein
MWPDCVENRDCKGQKLPKFASPCYLLLCKGNPDGRDLEQAEIQFFRQFVDEQVFRNPVGAPWLANTVVDQTRPDTWYPHTKCRHLLLYYQPWRQHHHDASTSGGYLQWSWHQSDKNARMVCAGQGGGPVSGDVTAQNPVLPIPKQELTLIKKGLDKYFLELRKLGLTVDAPSLDPDYFWIGHWNDDTVEATWAAKLCCGQVMVCAGRVIAKLSAVHVSRPSCCID